MGTLQKISFEFFPPRDEQKLEQTIRELNTLNPEFMTMTYGAAGSERANFLNNVKLLQTHSGTTPVVAHLTFYNTPKQELLEIVDTLWQQGVRHILALRGDKPENAEDKKGDDYFRYTSDFVEWLRNIHNFKISVATYPEKHPDSKNVYDDIIALRKKQDAGAHQAITQVVFNEYRFFKFRDDCVKKGIRIPIIPGLLPVTDYKQMERFVKKCGGTIPQSIMIEFNQCAQNDHAKKGQELLSKFIENFTRKGVEHLHFYTLNRSQPLMQILPQFL
jgi:methylenetetrahydrofolate reductase (NADPH)